MKRDIRRRTAEYKKFCSDVGLEERMDKTYDFGFVPKKRVDFSGGSGIIKSKECEIHPDKINKFFLKPGAKHSQEFFDVGYTEKDFERLQKDLQDGFNHGAVVDKVLSNNGVEKFSVFMMLGVDRKRSFRTVWQKDTASSKPRIITAHREDEKNV